MGKSKRRFVGRSEANQGWRIWDNKIGRWWGQNYQNYPEQLLDELNGEKRPASLVELAKQTKKLGNKEQRG